MVSFRDSYSQDPHLVENGAWVEFDDGVRVQIRSFQSKESKDVRKRLMLPHAAFERRGKSLPDDVSEQILIRQMAEAIIVSWEGVTDAEGNVLECNLENKLAILTDKSLTPFRDDIAMAAAERNTFKRAVVENTVKY